MTERPDLITLKEDIYTDERGRKASAGEEGARLLARAGPVYRREALLEYMTDEAIEAVRVKDLVADYYIGISLGSPGSASGVALVERVAERVEGNYRPILISPVYHVRWVRTHPPEETYLSLGRDVAQRAEKCPGGGGACNIVLDWTDVGNATAGDVGNQLPKRSILACVRIRPDAPPTRDDLISKTVSLLEARELKIDAALAAESRLDTRLREFTRRKPGAGFDPFALKERAGDETIVACLVALFYASHVNAFNPPQWL